MVEMKTNVSLRAKRRRERLEKIRSARPKGGIRVVPTDEKYRVLRHPSGIAFRPEGSIEWPNDRFTKKRIAEGVIKAEEKQETQSRQRRSQPSPSSAE
jgi:hypothetical protein